MMAPCDSFAGGHVVAMTAQFLGGCMRCNLNIFHSNTYDKLKLIFRNFFLKGAGLAQKSLRTVCNELSC